MREILYTQSNTDSALAAGVTTDILPAEGVELSQVDRITIFLKNTGSNTITATTITYSIGALTVTDTTSIGTISAGAIKTLSLAPGSTDPAYQRMKLTAASTSGSTVSVEVLAVRNFL